jgi:hypothetical protein
MVDSAHIHTALGKICKNILFETRGEAVVLCDNSLVDKWYDLTNINRDIDDAWVREMKQEIIRMHQEATFMTNIIVGIDVRDIESLVINDMLLDVNVHDHESFRAKVYDGQHRMKAYSELYRENPAQLYQFMVTVYLIHTDDQEKQLLEKLNKRREFTELDRKVVDGRKTFLDVWNEVTGVEHQSRMCVRNIRGSKKIRDKKITDALTKMSAKSMKEFIEKVADAYKDEFMNKCKDPKFLRSAVFKVIADTQLYQLVRYYNHIPSADDWLYGISG